MGTALGLYALANIFFSDQESSGENIIDHLRTPPKTFACSSRVARSTRTAQLWTSSRSCQPSCVSMVRFRTQHRVKALMGTLHPGTEQSQGVHEQQAQSY